MSRHPSTRPSRAGLRAALAARWLTLVRVIECDPPETFVVARLPAGGLALECWTYVNDTTPPRGWACMWREPHATDAFLRSLSRAWESDAKVLAMLREWRGEGQAP